MALYIAILNSLICVNILCTKIHYQLFKINLIVFIFHRQHGYVKNVSQNVLEVTFDIKNIVSNHFFILKHPLFYGFLIFQNSELGFIVRSHFCWKQFISGNGGFVYVPLYSDLWKTILSVGDLPT